MLKLINKNLQPEFDSIKDQNEEILWTDKPKFIPYTITAFSLGLFVLISSGFYYLVIKNISNVSNATDDFLIWFTMLPLGLFFISFLVKVLSYNNTSYAYTDKRIMVRSGFLGTDFKVIDYDKISDIEVSVSFVENLFGVGSIKFYSGRTEFNDGIITKLYDRWEAISFPYEVFKNLKQVATDVKTDFNYPNALRPDVNPGYKTKYTPKRN
ncbi:PH domain-containing protein [Parasediminibacterium paludis]|uniref:PH domain-containing protein n=1 Tax=Parasediminibacterium paludis TaxID=908966 RepID=A0ABV8PVW9_9BACT